MFPIRDENPQLTMPFVTFVLIGLNVAAWIFLQGLGSEPALYPRVHVHMLVIFGFYVTTFAVPAVFMLGYWIVIQVLGGMASIGQSGGGVAFWAHIGGFVAGAVLILLFRDRRLLDRHPYHGWKQKSHASRGWHRVSGGGRRRRW